MEMERSLRVHRRWLERLDAGHTRESTDVSTGVATYAFTNSLNDANYSVNATHYNRAAGSADPSHHTSSSHTTSWWQPSAGAVGDVAERGSIQVCGDLA